MSHQRARLRPLYIPHRKYADFERPPDLRGGSLSPDLQPNTPPSFGEEDSKSNEQQVCRIGKYLLLEQQDSNGNVQIYKAVQEETQEVFICKVIPIENYRDKLSAYWLVNSHCHVNEIEEILLGDKYAYVFFVSHHGDLHSYVRKKRKLREPQACQYFKQIVSAVAHCHENGVVLRDLKLRKFVFKDEDRTKLKLEGLEDTYVLEDSADDALADKHGCPAYVSPEILDTVDHYSGRAADMWSLGVMLYTLLVGRYPFHHLEPSALFTKIRQGQYDIPDSISSKAKCLIRSLLRQDPCERLTATEVMGHPWLQSAGVSPHKAGKWHRSRTNDQTVPDIKFDEEEESFFT